MELLIGIANLVVLLIVIEGWVKGRIPAALAKTTAERIDARINDAANRSNARLDGLDTRMSRLGTRLDGLDSRLDELGTRLDGLDTRVNELGDRLAEFDSRFDRVEAQVAVLNAQASKQIGDLDRHVREQLRGLGRRPSAPETEAGSDAAGTS